MLAHWDPFSEISRLQQNLVGRKSVDDGFRPAVDIYEDDQGVHVKADLAGVKPEDLNVDVENSVLTIKGERRMETTDDKNGYHRVERRYGAFTRSFALTDDVDPDKIEADYKDGVLNIVLPHAEKRSKRNISVKAEG